MLSWWENEEPVSKPDQEGTASTTSGGTGTGTGAPTSSLVASTSISSNGSEAGSKLSPVYSMDVHSDALWALLGTESGGINLVTVRHDEGKCHHVLRSHTAPVSVLKITSDQTGVISGSWDKTVLVNGTNAMWSRYVYTWCLYTEVVIGMGSQYGLGSAEVYRSHITDILGFVPALTCTRRATHVGRKGPEYFHDDEFWWSVHSVGSPRTQQEHEKNRIIRSVTSVVLVG